MKNHIAFKFLAVFFAALSLFGAIISAAGIIGFTAGELYERTPEEVLTESLQSRSQWFAQDIARNYAEKNLGNCPDELLSATGHFFNSGYYGYRLTDAEGNVLESLPLNGYCSRQFTYTAGGEYMKVLNAYPEEEPEPEVELIDAVPAGGTAVEYLEILTADSGNHGISSGAGYIYRDGQGRVIFVAHAPYDFRHLSGASIERITFFDQNSDVIYETAFDPDFTQISVTQEGYWTLIFNCGTAESAAVAEVSLDLSIIDNVSEEDAQVYSMYVDYLDGGQVSMGGVHPIGQLSHTELGMVHFQGTGYMDQLDHYRGISRIVFYPKNTAEGPLYEISCPQGVGVFSVDQELANTHFISYFISPQFAQDTEVGAVENTVPTYQETEPAETAVSTAAGEDVLYYGYWDSGSQESMVAEFVWEEMPEYTVVVQLAEGATDEDIYWDLLTEVWNYRNELFYLLGASLLVFAVMAVYLCCAAGKRPGQPEPRPAGFNAIPLDLYGTAGCAGVVLIVGFGVEVAEYLIRYSPDVLVPFILFAGFGCCLIFVGFCFACAAQFKIANGYWWRNLLICRCCALAARMLMAAVRFLDQKVEPLLVRLCKWLWALCVRIFRWCVKVLKAVFRMVFHFFDDTLDRFFKYLWQKFARFFGMLPLTWQWLLVGLVLISIFLLSLAAGSLVLLWTGVILTVAVLLYVSHAFGILLENTKKMSQGDLETKVSDQFLLGSFKEFAGDLNALADVAVVAAQKQLKSERMKTELITNVSHDIKTPLTSIINYVDLLQKPHTEEEQEIYLEVLSRQSQQLKKLIEDLMEMSKASTGNIAVDIAAINAGEAVNQALGEFADKLEKAQLTPVFRQPNAPIYMKADGRLAWRVMGNLLGNAVKYALPGTRLYIDLLELEGKVIISFKNISREELNVSADELLERFVRGDVSRNTEGSGLGLNIAQSLMELQKGQLQLLVDGDLFKVTLVFPAVKE